MIWSLILNPPDPNLWVQKCKKGRHALLSQISYCALQLRLLHPTAPIIFWMNFSVFLSQKNWYAMGCQESESVGSYCVEMSLIDGCDQTLTKRSPSKYLQVFQTQSFLFLWNQLFFFFFPNRKLLSTSTWLHFLSISDKCRLTAMSGRYHENILWSFTKSFAHRESVGFSLRYWTTQ